MNNSEGLKSFQQSLAGLPQWVSERILQQINQLTHYEPVIGIMGKSGAGKSSLCNALFASEVSPVSDVAACTREPLRFRLQVGDCYMTLMDLPGVGESGTRDTEYAALYREQLSRLDLVLWLIKADDRALAVDEHFYHQVIGEAYRHKVLFVISQSDKAEPTSGGGPLSTAQKQNISRKICLLHELFQPVHPVCAVSVRLQWGLRVMAERMIKCLPREATSPVVSQLQPSFRTTVVREQARSDFGETVGALLDRHLCGPSFRPCAPPWSLWPAPSGISSSEYLIHPCYFPDPVADATGIPFICFPVMRSLLMTRLASRFGAANLIRRDRPLTREELFRVVPSVFSEDKHESRSERYTYIPTISLLDSLQREGFQPFFACQTRVRDPGRREHTKHMLRLRREGQITGIQVPEIILLNSHDGTSSYQMLPGLFRAVCQNGLVCGESFGEVRVPHKGDVVSQVIEGAYEVLGIFDRVEEKRDAMQSLLLPPPAQQALAKAALTYRFGEDHQPVTESQILSPRRWQDESNDLWTTYQRIQENLIKGGLSGRNVKGERTHTRAVRGIDGDVKLNRALWVMAETLLTQLH